MRKTKKVALTIPVWRLDTGQFVRGVMDYASQRGKWTLDINPEAYLLPLQTLAGWSGDGVVASLRTKAQLRAAQTLGVPVVNVAGALRPGGVPRVMVDQEALGRMAAEHFLQRGFHRTGYFGQAGMWYSKQRERGFVEQITRAGGECSVLEAPRNFDASHPWHLWKKPLAQWLSTLVPPVGVMAVHDYRARMLLDACLHLGLRVPQDVALIGVDNSEVICEFSQVPLSSVARNNWREGYEAAALLDRLMAGKRPPAHDVLIQPEGVVTRRSTDAEAIENPHVAAAVRFIREHLGERFGVETLEKHAGISSRSLYYQFHRSLNCTPHHYITRARIGRAKEMLASPSKPKLHSIARACGFSETRRLRLAFQRIVGMTLAEYRRSLTARR
jgi:LacI family transcriptional regulator